MNEWIYIYIHIHIHIYIYVCVYIIEHVVGELPFLLVESRFVLIDSTFLIRSLNLNISWIPIFVPLLSSHKCCLFFARLRCCSSRQDATNFVPWCRAMPNSPARFPSDGWMTGWPGLGGSAHGQRYLYACHHMPWHAQKTSGIAGALFKIETSSFGWLQIAIRVI